MLDRYGPFSEIIAIAFFLVAAFSVLIIKMFGRTKNWTWLAGIDNSVTAAAGPRAVSVSLIAVTYLTITKDNYGLYLALSVACGILTCFSIGSFERMRSEHVRDVPVVNVAVQ